MKKILVISNMYPSEKDPTYGTFIKNFIEGIQEVKPKWQIEKIVIAGRSGNKAGKIRKYASFYTSIIWQLLIQRYDLVYVHIVTHAALPLRFISLFRKLPLVFNAHGEDILTQSRLAAIFLKMAIPLMRQARLIVIPSAYFKTRFCRLLPVIPEEKLYVSPSGGVNTHLFRPHPCPKPQYTIGYVSRIDRGKGWDTFLSAISILNKQEIPVRGIIAGKGAETSIFMETVKKLDLQNIEYLGAVPHSKLPEIYTRMDAFIFPTKLEESLGLVALEAMACGIPVIGSQIGGLTDYIVNDYNGFFFQPANPEALAEAIIKHYNMPATKRRELSGNACQTASRYDQKTVFIELVKHL